MMGEIVLMVDLLVNCFVMLFMINFLFLVVGSDG